MPDSQPLPRLSASVNQREATAAASLADWMVKYGEMGTVAVTRPWGKEVFRVVRDKDIGLRILFPAAEEMAPDA
jgi:hypothetical protein